MSDSTLVQTNEARVPECAPTSLPGRQPMASATSLRHRHRRVPVEHRTFGIDRRTLPWAIVAIGVWALWTLVGPAVNAAIPWTDETRSGDVLRVAETVAITPPVGWGLQSGIRTTDRSGLGTASPPPVILTQGGVQMDIRSAPWTGSATELLDAAGRIEDAQSSGAVALGSPGTFTTDTGVPGVLRTASSTTGEGILAAVVIDGTGVRTEVFGPPDQVAALAPSIRRVLESTARSTP